MKKTVRTFIIIVIIIIISIIIIMNKNYEARKKSLKEWGQTAEILTREKELQNFYMEILNLDDQTKRKIPDADEFLIELKYYMYQNGIIEGKVLEMAEKKEENGILKIRFVFDDPKRTKIIASIDLNEEQKYEFYHYE